MATATYAAWNQGLTYDEYYHLRWSERLVFRGETERVTNERWNSKTPVMVPGVLAQRAAALGGIHDPRALRFASRLPTLGWLAALLGMTFCFSRRWLGPLAAQIATIGVALDPNLVAHGSLATADVANALATVLTLAAALHFAEEPRPSRGLLLGLALGFAFVAKFSAFVLLPGLLLVLVWRPQKTADLRSTLAGLAVAGLAVAGLAAWALLWVAYLFREVGAPLGSHAWRSAFLAGAAEATPGLPSPLPLAFLTGIDLSLAHERTKTFPVYLLGRQHPNGVWFYFGVLWLLKTPLLALGAQVIGMIRTAREGLLRANPALRFLALNLAWHLAYFSLLFRAQVGYRFVLICVPLAWILAATGLASLGRSRGLPLAGLAVVLVAVLENGLYLGNPLAFTNAAVWPKSEVFRLMADSNLDWGQNRDKIDGWLGEKRARLDPAQLLPGTNILSVNVLAGVKGGFERQRWLRENVTPKGHLGHTYVWFELDPELYMRFRSEAGLR